jgi:hypothetical protein
VTRAEPLSAAREPRTAGDDSGKHPAGSARPRTRPARATRSGGVGSPAPGSRQDRHPGPARLTPPGTSGVGSEPARPDHRPGGARASRRPSVVVEVINVDQQNDAACPRRASSPGLECCRDQRRSGEVRRR